MKKLLSLVLATLLAVTFAAPALSSPALPEYRPAEWTKEMREAAPNPVKLPPGTKLPPTYGPKNSKGATSLAVAGTPTGAQRYFPVLTLTGYALRLFTLRTAGQYGEIWVANDLSFPAGDPRNPDYCRVTDAQLNLLMQEFDTNIYTRETEFFGQPDALDGSNSQLSASYGYYDGSSRVIILVDNVRDESYYDYTYPNYIAGFFSTAIEEYTDRNIITIDCLDWANRVGPNDRRPYLYEGVFAHEFQHLLHSDHDSDEEDWINEGQSMYAEYFCGYNDLNADAPSFLYHPYNSLVAWEDMGGYEVLADYSAVYLFQVYLSQQYGGSGFIRALHTNPLNGIEGLNDTLRRQGYSDTFETVYRDWQTAVLINSPQPGNGRYQIEGLASRIDFSVHDPLAYDENDNPIYDEHEYSGPDALAWGPSYNLIKNSPKIYDITLNGVQFMGTKWQVSADPAGSGTQVLWGGQGDLLDNALIKPLDLTSARTATLTFDTWYQIEEAWDYAFVQVSTDDGQTWHSLGNRHTNSIVDPDAHPTVVENLPGFTGASRGWVTETFDLTPYAGQKILVSFRYVTDWATSEAGFFICNIKVPEVGFAADGTSLAQFYSLDEVRRQLADYLITFVGETTTQGQRTYKVMHLKMVNLDENDQLNLQQFLRDSSLGNVTMIVTYAAPVGRLDSVPYSYAVEYHKLTPAPAK